jgi:hypothetical protein
VAINAPLTTDLVLLFIHLFYARTELRATAQQYYSTTILSDNTVVTPYH